MSTRALRPIDWWAPTTTPVEAQCAATRSSTRQYAVCVNPPPPYSFGTVIPSTPSLASPSSTDCGRRSSSSILAASTSLLRNASTLAISSSVRAASSASCFG
jgi:hypothetical protein